MGPLDTLISGGTNYGEQTTPTGETLDSKLDLAGVTDTELRDRVNSFCKHLNERKNSFISATKTGNLASLAPTDLIMELETLKAKNDEDALAFDEDAKTDKKKELQRKVAELNARKWLSEQKASISAEIGRLKAVNLLEVARRQASTTALSSKMSALAESLVTEAFAKRFEDELKILGASKLQVKITKTKTTKGHVWHQIKLKNAKHAVVASDILSEGEFRIVSIAAFLADVATDGANRPFIFDDPISSLDQDFEELTASRLVELGKTRQVIVFTHRLSLLAMLEDTAKRAAINCQVVSLRREPWGAGEPNQLPITAQNPKKVINVLIGERLPKARKVLTEQGDAAYQIESKALCSDIRITLERLVESELLADVVQRFRRAVNTLGKIGNLAKITTKDCQLIDAMMTKYSRYEHSQPGEAPVALPQPEEFEEDLKSLKTWQEEFGKRVVTASSK